MVGDISPIDYCNMVGDIKTMLLTQDQSWEREHAAKLQSGGDLTWQAAFPCSVIAFWDLLEALLFTKKFSASIYNGLKAHRSAADILESDELKTAITSIADAAKAEQAEAATAAKTNAEQQLPAKADEDVQHDVTTPAFVAATAACPTASIDDLAHYVEKADKIVKRSIQLIGPPKDATLTHVVEKTTVGKLVGGDRLRQQATFEGDGGLGHEQQE